MMIHSPRLLVKSPTASIPCTTNKRYGFISPVLIEVYPKANQLQPSN